MAEDPTRSRAATPGAGAGDCPGWGVNGHICRWCDPDTMRHATPDRVAVMPDHFERPFAEDIDGVWHVRRDDFWDNDIHADVRAHAACGADIWSCHVSEFPPVLGDRKARHCRGCFPLGRKPRSK